MRRYDFEEVSYHGMPERWELVEQQDGDWVRWEDVADLVEQDRDALTDPPEPGRSVAAYSKSLGWCAGELYRDERVSVWHLATAQGVAPDPGDVTHWRPWPAAPGGKR